MRAVQDTAASLRYHPSSPEKECECAPLTHCKDPRVYPSDVLMEGYAAVWSYKERCWYAVSGTSRYWLDPKRARWDVEGYKVLETLDPAVYFSFPPESDAVIATHPAPIPIPPPPLRPQSPEATDGDEYIELSQHNDRRTWPDDASLGGEYLPAWSDEKRCWFAIRKTNAYWSDPRRRKSKWKMFEDPSDPAAYFLRLPNPVTRKEPKTPPKQDFWQVKALVDEFCFKGYRDDGEGANRPFPGYTSEYIRDPSPPFWGDHISIKFGPPAGKYSSSQQILLNLDPSHVRHGGPLLLEPDPAGGGHVIYMHVNVSAPRWEREAALIEMRLTEICRQFRWGLKGAGLKDDAKDEEEGKRKRKQVKMYKKKGYITGGTPCAPFKGG